MQYQDALNRVLAASRDEPHRLGAADEPCPCWRCVAHRLVLDIANSKEGENAEFRVHLAATRRRARKKAEADLHLRTRRG